MYHSRVIGVVSGKGGSGKTTTAVNMGVAYALLGKDVTLVDANLHNPNVGLHLGAPQVPIHLNHVLAGKNHMHDAVYQHKSGLKVVPASLQVADRAVSLQGFRSQVKQLLTDTIIVDTSSGFYQENVHALQALDEALVVTQPEWPALTDALKSLQVLRSLKVPCRGVVVTKSGSQDDVPVESMEQFLQSKVIAAIPFDAGVRESLRKKESLVFMNPQSPAADAYVRLAARLTGVSFPVSQKKFLGLF
ncbi:MAG: P-loop NTPase [Nanoarchaeota archaeon]|nr:P-loop NTPase [Nanoarchaeota archaeon]